MLVVPGKRVSWSCMSTSKLFYNLISFCIVSSPPSVLANISLMRIQTAELSHLDVVKANNMLESLYIEAAIGNCQDEGDRWQRQLIRHGKEWK